MSDVHIEFAPLAPTKVDADVVVLAGDIGEGVTGLQWARENFGSSPIVYVLGNHELYGMRLPDALAALRAEAKRLGIVLLENDEFVIGGIRFLGATMWTDFSLNATSPGATRRYMHAARRGSNDYRFIRYGEPRRKQRDRIQPEHVLAMHRASRAWLTSAIAQPFDGRTVVVTHHAPHPKSVPAGWTGDALTPAYATNMTDLFGPPVDLWIHGHIHVSSDYMVAGTKVVANPRGYAPGYANDAFTETFVLDL